MLDCNIFFVFEFNFHTEKINISFIYAISSKGHKIKPCEISVKELCSSIKKNSNLLMAGVSLPEAMPVINGYAIVVIKQAHDCKQSFRNIHI